MSPRSGHTECQAPEEARTTNNMSLERMDVKIRKRARQSQQLFNLYFASS